MELQMMEVKILRNEMNIHDFLSQVEVYRMGENMNEAQLLSKIPHLLIGSARTTAHGSIYKDTEHSHGTTSSNS